MPLFGNNVAGDSGFVYVGDNMMGHFDYSEMASWGLPVPLCVVNKIWLRATGSLAVEDNAVMRFGIYDASSGDPATYTLEATSPTFTVPQGAGEQWWSVDCEIELQAGKYALAVLCTNAVNGARLRHTGKPSGESFKATVGGAFPNPLGGSLTSNTQDWSMYAEYTEGGLPPDPTTSLLACIEPPLRPTSGRTTTYEVGHPPGNVLDGNPNTYWKPDTLTDKILWFDLGEAVVVDAVVFWLRNYNEAYGSLKAWKLSHSSDDNTYTPLTEKVFEDERDSGSPLAVDELSAQVSARYWKLELLHFDEHTPGPKVEIGGVWFMNSYDLKYRSQLPDSDLSGFGSVIHGSASGNEYPEETHRGRSDLLTREFLITSASEYGKLRDAYRASRGSCRPIVLKPNVEDVWKMCTFDGRLSESQREFELYRPTVRLREVGFKRVPFAERVLPLLTTTVGRWRMNGDMQDDSGNGNHMTEVNVDDSDFIDGDNERGKTALVMYDGAELAFGYITSSAAGDFDMGTDDFTVEVKMLVPTNATTTKIVQKGAGTPFAGFQILAFVGGGIITFGAYVGDGTNQVINIRSTGKDVGDNEWHYCVMVVDRGDGKVRIYIDGVQYGGDFDISSVTGDISRPDQPLYIRSSTVLNTTFDEVCISRQAIPLALIQERAAGFANYGTWGI